MKQMLTAAALGQQRDLRKPVARSGLGAGVFMLNELKKWPVDFDTLS
jgi:hypothetical protein